MPHAEDDSQPTTAAISQSTPDQSSTSSSPTVLTPPSPAASPIQAEEPVYRIIHDFQPQSANELPLIVGNTVTILDKDESGWWFAKDASGQGWIPSSYLKEGKEEEEEEEVPQEAPPAAPGIRPTPPPAPPVASRLA